MPLAPTLLNRIVAFYLNSDDFNGIRANVVLEESGPDALAALKKLVGKGLVEVYSSVYDNPHIKRLPALSIPQQIGFLDAISGEEHVCLFPSVKAMRRRLPSNKYRTKPFSRFLALGHAQLEPLFFRLGVLERYQSDPRYIFHFAGLEGSISVKTAAYMGREMGGADKVSIETFGLGTSPKGHRVIVTFPRYLSSFAALQPRNHVQSLTNGQTAARGGSKRANNVAILVNFDWNGASVAVAAIARGGMERLPPKKHAAFRLTNSQFR